MSEASTEGQGPSNPRRATRVQQSDDTPRVRITRRAAQRLRVRVSEALSEGECPGERASTDRPRVHWAIASEGPALIHAPLRGFYDGEGPVERKSGRDQPTARVGRALPRTIIIWEPHDGGSNRVSAMIGSTWLNRTLPARGWSLASGRSTGPRRISSTTVPRSNLRAPSTRLFSCTLLAPSMATSGSDTGRRAMSGC